MKEKCECGNDNFMVWNDFKFKHVWITCTNCKKQKDILKNHK